jgi:Flp pilus assembly protein TadD
MYAKNMAALKETHPDLHKWIEAQVDVDWLVADGNQLHVTVGTVSHPVYDVGDPLKELSEIDALPLHKENVTVFIGLGLGHTVARALAKAEKGHHVIVVEPVAHMCRLAFALYDFSAAIKSRSLFIVPGKAEVDMVIGFLEGYKVVADWQVLVDRTCMQRREYGKLTEYTMEILNQVQCNTGTVTSAGAKIADNDVATLPYVIRHRGVAELVGLFAGKPAVCVSTGPSLARNIHILKEIQDNVVIIAVGQALRPLLAYDIRPDFICTVDFGEVNMTHYAGLCDSDVPLVTINKTYAPLLRAYRGPKFISAGAHAVETTHVVLKDMGELPQGGSVAHMVFGLAANMGCDPVIFVGQDLALGEASHFGQADSMGKVEVVDGQIKWRVDDPRSTTLHGRDDIGMGPAVYTPGWWGAPVLTNTGLLTFITAMQRLVAQSSAVVINCTEGGAHIEGARRMFLRDAALKYCGARVDKSCIEPLLSLHPDADARIAAALPLLRHDMKILDIIVDNSEKGLVTVEQMRRTTSAKKLKRLFVENAKYSAAASEGAQRLPPVGVAIYGARRRIESRELNVSQKPGHLLGNRKDLLTRLTRNEVVLTAARDAATELKKSYAACETAFMAYAGDKTALDSTGETTLADISDASHYLDAGNFAKPLLEAQRILDYYEYNTGPSGDRARNVISRAHCVRANKIQEARAQQDEDYASGRNLLPQYFDLIEDSRKLGRDTGDMDAALAVVRKAIDLLPDREEARWGLASALLHLGRQEEAVVAYEELVKRFADNPRFIFEYGQALILAGRAADGFARIQDAMSKSEEFDAFSGALAKLYVEHGLTDEARAACALHLSRYPNDRDVKVLLETLNGIDKGPTTASEVSGR